MNRVTSICSPVIAADTWDGRGELLATPAGKAVSLDEVARRFRSGADVGGGGGVGGPASPHRQTSWVYLCIYALADAAQRVPIRLSRGEASGTRSVWGLKGVRAGMARRRAVCGDRTRKAAYRAAEGEIVESGDLYALMERPNPGQTWGEFAAATVWYMYVWGRVHWLLDDMIGRRPRVLYAVPGGNSKPIVDRREWPQRLDGWRFTLPNGKPLDVPVEDCITLQMFDPDDPFRGLSPRVPARLAIASHYNASTFNATAFSNNCEPGVVLSMPGTPTREQLDHTGQQWQARYGGPSNARRVAVLYGGMTAEPFGSTLQEMAWPDGMKIFPVEICAVYRVPMSVAGFMGTSGDSSALATTDLERFWQDSAGPLIGKLAEAADIHLAPRFPGNLQVWADVEDVPIFGEMQKRAVAAAMPLWDRGVPMADLNEVYNLGLPTDDRPQHDIGWVPMNLVPAAAAAAGPAAIDEGDPGDIEDIEPRAEQRSAEEDEPDPDPIDKLASAAIDRLWLSWERSWRPIAERMNRLFRARYSRQERLLTAALKASQTPNTQPSTLNGGKATNNAQDSTPNGGGDPQLSIGGCELTVRGLKDAQIDRLLAEVIGGDPADVAKFRASLRSLSAAGSEVGIRQALLQCGLASEALDGAMQTLISNPAIIDGIRAHSVIISTRVDAGTRHYLRGQLEQGLADGESMGELIDRVHGVMGNRRSAAATIARNSVAQATDIGAADARASYAAYEIWLHSRGPGKRREGHVAAERRYAAAPKRVGVPFNVAGVHLRYPRDPRGPAEEIINCQCIAVGSPGGRDGGPPAIAEFIGRAMESYEGIPATAVAGRLGKPADNYRRDSRIQGMHGIDDKDKDPQQ